MSEKGDDKISKLLKASPKLTPPESFYRGVLQEIERRKGPTEEKAPWFWGYPAKALVSACVLLIIVVTAHETRTSKPELFQQKVELPSPFPEVAAKEKSNLRAELKDINKSARDKVGGIASQNSFLQEQNTLSSSRKAPLSMPHSDQLSNGVRAGQLASNSAAPEAPRRELALAKKQQKGFEIAGPIASLEILKKEIPIYPAEALDQGLQGTVRLYLTVKPDGSVDPKIRITQTSGYPLLDQAAINAVQKWQFSPAQQPSWGILTFQLVPIK